MKIILLALLLVVFPLFPQATGAGEKNSPKKSEKDSKSTITFAITPFDLTAEKLPENYAGHSILDIYQKLVIPKSKGEFEKSEEYEARLDRWKATPILGKITPSDTLAFWVSELSAPDVLSLQYDADTEKLTANIAFGHYYGDTGDVRWLEMFYNSKSLGQYMGITRMGVKFRVASHAASRIGIGVTESIEPISLSKDISRDEAVRIKPLLRVFAIVTLDEPYKLDGTKSVTASLDDPNEWLIKYRGLYVNLKAILIVNKKTGEIIARADAPFKRCDYGICL